jgi:hypothetical protein
MSTLADIQTYNTAFQHTVNHVGQDEEKSLFFEDLSATNTPQTLAEFTAWSFSDSGIDGRQLPPDVAYELRIAESLVDAQSLFVNGTFQASSVRHESPAGTRRFRIVGEPIWPSGAVRVWRFWLAPAEVV